MVAIDCSDEACAVAREMGLAVVQGDASDNNVLEAVHIERAATLVASAGRDDTSILIILTARSLASKLTIAVSINAEDNEDIAAHAGATTVINPITVSAKMLAAAAHRINAT
jgi:voltage-gated potassium channel